jgi:hypothetical protein
MRRLIIPALLILGLTALVIRAVVWAPAPLSEPEGPSLGLFSVLVPPASVEGVPTTWNRLRHHSAVLTADDPNVAGPDSLARIERQQSARIRRVAQVGPASQRGSSAFLVAPPGERAEQVVAGMPATVHDRRRAGGDRPATPVGGSGDAAVPMRLEPTVTIDLAVTARFPGGTEQARVNVPEDGPGPVLRASASDGAEGHAETIADAVEAGADAGILPRTADTSRW